MKALVVKNLMSIVYYEFYCNNIAFKIKITVDIVLSTRIVDMNADSFIDVLGTLQILEVSFGFYQEFFPEHVFKSLTSLQWIALDNNNFRSIAETALYSFGELTYFNMDSNRLSFLPKTLFHQVRMLP